MARERTRVCAECGRNRVLSGAEATAVYGASGLDDHERKAIDRAKNDPYRSCVCSWCYAVQARP